MSRTGCRGASPRTQQRTTPRALRRAVGSHPDPRELLDLSVRNVVPAARGDRAAGRAAITAAAGRSPPTSSSGGAPREERGVGTRETTFVAHAIHRVLELGDEALARIL